MKGINLYQPWAWLMQLGAKQIETRSWPWPPKLLNQPTLICSTASSPASSRELFRNTHFTDALTAAGIKPSDTFCRMPTLERGAFLNGHALAVGWPVASLESHIRCYRQSIGNGVQMMPPRSFERVFGDYSPGRYGTLFAGIIRLPQPFPIKGGQKVWNVTPANEARVIEQLGTLTPPVEAWIER